MRDIEILAELLCLPHVVSGFKNHIALVAGLTPCVQENTALSCNLSNLQDCFATNTESTTTCTNGRVFFEMPFSYVACCQAVAASGERDLVCSCDSSVAECSYFGRRMCADFVALQTQKLVVPTPSDADDAMPLLVSFRFRRRMGC